MNIHLYISHPHWSAHCVGAICRANVVRCRTTSSDVVRSENASWHSVVVYQWTYFNDDCTTLQTHLSELCGFVC